MNILNIIIKFNLYIKWTKIVFLMQIKTNYYNLTLKFQLNIDGSFFLSNYNTFN